jgi:hypothetical protein
VGGGEDLLWDADRNDDGKLTRAAGVSGTFDSGSYAFSAEGLALHIPDADVLLLNVDVFY